MGFTGFLSLGCDASYGPDEDLLLCPRTGSLLEATYDLSALRASLDRDALERRPNTVWRWRELLPVRDYRAIVSLGEGGTVLLRCDKIAAAIGVRELWVKSDASNPTGSLKDRSITVSATKAVEFGYGTLSCDSTGNKASSTAAYAARAGLRSVVFCGEDAPAPKVMQALFFGASLVRVRGGYAEINAMYRRLIHSGQVKWYDCGTDNPYRYEGKKTYAYEIAHGLGWRVPDRVVQPANGGMSLTKAWKGFNELRELGWTDALPRMTLVQAENCAPIVRAWKSGAKKVAPIQKQPTIATALAGADPGLLGNRALDAVYASSGNAVAVPDSDTIDAVRLLASEGLFIEPSGAVAIAGVRRLVEEKAISPEERIVCVVTGSGFKDADRMGELVTMPTHAVDGYEELLEASLRIA